VETADSGGTEGPPTGPLLCIVGPTATGKSELAVTVAEQVGGEVVNADASQLYRGMDIGTAKLPAADRRGVAHHLLDVLDVTDEASVAAYQRAARTAIAGIVGRGRLPVLVGGSGLYVSAVLDPLVFPGTDPAVRSRLDSELAAAGPAALHARLAVLDPAAAGSILPGNGRRIVRALEVIELTGKPFVASLPAAERRPPGVAVLRTEDEPGALDARIAERVDAMWAAGFVAEVRALLPAGLREGRTASRALGYAQVLDLLDGVVESEAVARADTVRATRRFARRQRSWFARDHTAGRCPVGPDATGIALAVAADCLRAASPRPAPPGLTSDVFA
jgi:tRNA dimethylallyltransferase